MGKADALSALRELVREIKLQRTDVVVVCGYNAEALGRLAARIAGVRATVLWAHNMGDIEPRGRIRTAADRLLERWTTAYFGVADAQRSVLVERFHYPEPKIRILHNGVDPAEFAAVRDVGLRADLGFSPEESVVGIVAALRPEKDHATFLRAARLVVDVRPDSKFLLVGDGPLRNQLELLCGELGIDSNVVFVGDRRDVPRLLGAIDVFGLSSRTECFPIAVLEAMATGLPVVATNVGGLPEMVIDGHTGFLVPAGDFRGLADRLLEILSNPVLGRGMGWAGRARVQAEFDLQQTIPLAEQALEEVVSMVTSGGMVPIR
jgi:glycosyltransferase involved in cell wall biosynthesis